MRAPAFWQRPQRGLMAKALSPVAAAYGAVASRRLARDGLRAPVAVVCVGNFTAGGAGKTPTALAIARALRARGERPFFLTRGYGGQSGPEPVRVDLSLHDARQVGDEALLLARCAPTIVGADRILGARVCVQAGASVIVMDDGLQNPSLAKDYALAVIDATVGIGNGLCLPAGPLRAPMSRQWPLVDDVLLLGDGIAGETLAAQAELAGKPVWRARLAPQPAAIERLRARKVLAFAGIGRPEKFFATLESMGARIAARVPFPDHHTFSARDLARLRADAERAGAILVTTEKDAARIGPANLLGIDILPVDLQVDDEAGFFSAIARAVERR